MLPVFLRELVEGDHSIPVAEECLSGRAVAVFPAPPQEHVSLFFGFLPAFGISYVLQSPLYIVSESGTGEPLELMDASEAIVPLSDGSIIVPSGL